MNENKAIVSSHTNGIIQKDDINQLKELGTIFRQSGYFPDLKNEAQAVVKIMVGKELGMSPMVAMENVYVITTKDGANIQISANLIASKIKASGKYNYKVLESNKEKCVIEFYEDGEKAGTYEFTMKDAAAAGLTNRYIWKAYPKNMLFNRCISNGYKTFCPDIFSIPVYYKGEVDGEKANDSSSIDTDNYNENNNIEEAEAQVVNADELLNMETKEEAPQKPQKPQRPYSFEILKEKFVQFAAKNTTPADQEDAAKAMNAIALASNYNHDLVRAISTEFTGKESLESCTAGECQFFLKWLTTMTDETGCLVPKDLIAVEELKNVYNTIQTGEVSETEGDNFADDLFGKVD